MRAPCQADNGPVEFAASRPSPLCLGSAAAVAGLLAWRIMAAGGSQSRRPARAAGTVRRAA